MILISLFCLVFNLLCNGYPLKDQQPDVIRVDNLPDIINEIGKKLANLRQRRSTNTSIDKWEPKIAIAIEEFPQLNLRLQLSIVDTPQLWFFVGISVVGTAGFIVYLIIKACRRPLANAVNCKTRLLNSV
ncbi:hypothetical protein JTE90_008759 [Oedothorax gibbosus]|uniref:Uncharacterized protein n=1 Tax=Oedothorax gibbosus TaxID=931172 RepID=A0AAV6UP56_9ARAC|nr:hypothetical protein JTE90_008759 [Oedothorax gibbosus]